MIESSSTTRQSSDGHTVTIKTGPSVISCECGQGVFCEHMMNILLEGKDNADIQAFIRTLPVVVQNALSNLKENNAENRRIASKIGELLNQYKMIGEA